MSDIVDFAKLQEALNQGMPAYADAALNAFQPIATARPVPATPTGLRWRLSCALLVAAVWCAPTDAEPRDGPRYALRSHARAWWTRCCGDTFPRVLGRRVGDWG